ncbi:MAG: hypothetical protein RLY31_1562 [Bacteroidota bacterium]
MPQEKKGGDIPTTYDAIVIGSGISGGWACKELTQKGLKTLCLERGRPVEHVKDYPTAMLPPWADKYRGRVTEETRKEYPIQSKNYAFSEMTKHFYVKDTEHPYTQKRPFWWIRGYQTGGKSLLWARQCWRLSERDFEENAMDGHGCDWPIRYQDLAPWYSYVEQYAGISGLAAGIAEVPDSPHFLPHMPLNCIEETFKGRIEKAFPGRRLIPSRPAHLTDDTHKERGRCQYRNLCHRGCPYGGYFTSVTSTIPDAMKTGNLTMRHHSIAVELVYDEKKGRASGVRVLDAQTGEMHMFRARIIFVNAACLNSTWLLLNSKSGRFPEGFGNDSGVVGKYLMDHHFQVGASGEFDDHADEYYFGRRPNHFLIPRYRNIREDAQPNYLRGFGMYGSGWRQGWGEVAAMKEVELGFGPGFKDAISRPESGKWAVQMFPFGECLPYESNRAYLDTDQLDKWGLPTLVMDAAFGENEKEMARQMLSDSVEMLEAAGATNIRTFDQDIPIGFGIHEMGTARMGRDPKTSALNGNNQLWACPNVFMTDGACMASSPFQNPSLTYMALTARACDFAVKELNRQNL